MICIDENKKWFSALHINNGSCNQTAEILVIFFITKRERRLKKISFVWFQGG